jgi:hypothetical protein
MNRIRDQRSQSLAEFALIAPVLLLIIFGIVDLGRAIFLYNTIQHAAREGGRVAVRDSTALPTDTDVVNQVKSQIQFVSVATPCPNGPVVTTAPPPGVAWVYVTEPNPPSSIEANPPMNAPGGEYVTAATGSCSAINPASRNATLQVTIKYNFSLLTPIASQLATNRIVMTAAAVVNTEY